MIRGAGRLAPQKGFGVATRSPFKSNALNAVDAKGRVSLPAEFRKVIETRAAAAAQAGNPVDDRMLSIRKHPFEPCLQAFDQTFERELSAMEEASGAADDSSMAAKFARGRRSFGGVAPVNYDQNGRMVLSAIHRRMAGIEDLAFFVGAEHAFEIWAPARLKDALKDSDPDLVENMMLLLEEKGIAP